MVLFALCKRKSAHEQERALVTRGHGSYISKGNTSHVEWAPTHDFAKINLNNSPLPRNFIMKSSKSV